MVQNDVAAILPVGRADLVAKVALQLLHPDSQPTKLVLEAEHVLDAGEIQPKLGGESLDQPEPLDVSLGVQPRSTRRPRRTDKPFRLVHPERLRVKPGELGGDGDHVERAVGHENAPFRGCSLETRW